MKKVAVLVSGGVDSSVALCLLKEQGYAVTAFYLKIWLEDELSYLGSCPWQDDLSYIETVCKQLDVPLNIISLQEQYWSEVVNYTVNEIKSGRTPNPDILCNQRIKFGAFYSKIDDSFDYVATGHYAQIKRMGEDIQLHCSPDIIKDQTYFLSHLTKKQLSRVLFPIGHLEKVQVRELAKFYNLPNKDRKDSQGICFLGKLKFSEFVKHHFGQKQGDLIEFETGNKVGTHNGYWFYTLGQRQGIGLAGGPWYVVFKDVKENIVYISNQYYTADKARDTLKITACNWIGQPIYDKTLSIKLRHGSNFHRGLLIKLNADLYQIKLNEQDHAITPGQFAVLYDGPICIGSGVITENDIVY